MSKTCHNLSFSQMFPCRILSIIIQPHVSQSRWIGSETTEHRSFLCMEEISFSETPAFDCERVCRDERDREIIYCCLCHLLSFHCEVTRLLVLLTFLSAELIFVDELVSNVPSVLWRCWLGGRKGTRPVKNWVVGCWCGYLSGARCRLAYGPADATATHCLLLQ